jgi:hypothetical protein
MTELPMIDLSTFYRQDQEYCVAGETEIDKRKELQRYEMILSKTGGELPIYKRSLRYICRKPK